MSEMLRLKGRVVRGELEGDEIKFDVNQINGRAGDGIGLRIRLSYESTFIIDPATIQPADDPRKAMLEEIRQLIKRLSPQHGWFVMLDKLLPALDEMEAKL